METPKLIKDLGMMYANEKSKQKKRYGIFRCFCGKEFTAYMYNIKSKRTSSCGCLKIKKISNLNKTHNLTNTKLYSIWENIKKRCLNPKNKSYKNYGGRGISICDEWKNNFKSFYDWAMTHGYEENLTIDRINNNDNYEPSNCRWTTKNIQARNTRRIMTTNKTGYRGVSIHHHKFRATLGVNGKKIYLGTFETKIEAAKAYDKYVIENNLEHTINGVL